MSGWNKMTDDFDLEPSFDQTVFYYIDHQLDSIVLSDEWSDYLIKEFGFTLEESVKWIKAYLENDRDYSSTGSELGCE